MLTIEKPRVLWAWVCPITGMVLDEWWANTEAVARSRTESSWGKLRTKQGDIRPVRVTVELLTDDETTAHRAEFAAWKAKRDAKSCFAWHAIDV